MSQQYAMHIPCHDDSSSDSDEDPVLCSITVRAERCLMSRWAVQMMPQMLMALQLLHELWATTTALDEPMQL